MDEVIGKDNYTFEANSYLQDGYISNLKDKIDFYDMNGNTIQLPDSNAIIVIGMMKMMKTKLMKMVMIKSLFVHVVFT